MSLLSGETPSASLACRMPCGLADPRMKIEVEVYAKRANASPPALGERASCLRVDRAIRHLPSGYG